MEVHDKLYIPSSESGIEKALNTLLANTYRKVIALGMYSGIDKNELRIETTCNTRFRNNKIFDIKHHSLSQSLKPTEHVKYARGLGNSWCNLLSVKILNHPSLQGTEYSFIHIPKSFDSKTASELIHQMVGKA